MGEGVEGIEEVIGRKGNNGNGRIKTKEVKTRERTDRS